MSVPAQALPPALVARAQAFASGGLPVAAPRDAATVVLVRDGGRGLEAYLMRRVSSMVFAAGMHAFPGGTVDVRDLEHVVPWHGPDPSTWADRFGADAALTRALVCAAVRETFEECGVLLAGPSATSIVADTTDAGWEGDRQALVDHTLAFSDLLASRELVLRADLLRPWAHWITPEFEERRYDTKFFVAALPVGQRTRDVGGEADRVLWLRPSDGVTAYGRGELAMLPPTIATLRNLAPYGTVAEVLAGADSRRISPIMPRAVVEGDDVRLIVPEEPV